MQSFNTEKEMGIKFENYINRINKNPSIFLLPEQKKLFGIPDFVVIENIHESLQLIVSIELKLHNWKRALKQAFRYKTFSNLAFVIVDEANVHNAIKEIKLFKHFSIGLASFSINNELKIYYYPSVEVPYSEYFTKNLIKRIDTSDRTSIVNNNFTIQNFINRFSRSLKNEEMESIPC